MWFSIGVPNFIKIGSSGADLWRHNDFQDGSRQPCWIWFRAMVAHPRSESGGLCFILKFRFLYFGILAWNCLFTPTFRRVLGEDFPQMTSSIVVAPKRHLLAWKHVVWAIKRENRSNGSTWARDREKRGRTDSQKKSERRYISPIWGEAPTGPIFTEICAWLSSPT